MSVSTLEKFTSELRQRISDTEDYKQRKEISFDKLKSLIRYDYLANCSHISETHNAYWRDYLLPYCENGMMWTEDQMMEFRHNCVNLLNDFETLLDIDI